MNKRVRRIPDKLNDNSRTTRIWYRIESRFTRMMTYLEALQKNNYLSYPMGGRACKTSVILMVHCKLKRKLERNK